MKYVTWLWLNMRGIRWNTAMRVIIGIGQVGLGLMMVWLSRVFIDKTIRSGSAEDVMQMVLWLVMTVVGGVVLRQVYYYMTTTANVRQTNMLRLRIFSRLFHRQLFGDKTMHSGDITSRLAKDIDTVSSVTTDSIPQMSVTMIQLCGAFLMMRWFDARLAWALLILTPVAIIFGKLIARKLRKMTLDIRQDESKIQMQVQETMEHNAVLRSLGSEQWVTERLDTMQQRLQGNVMRRTRFTVITRLIMGCVFGLGYLMAFVWGGIGLRNGTITFGVMTSFLQLVGMIQHPILQMLNMVPGIIHATASIDRLEELDQTEQEFTTEGRTPEKEVPGIRFNNTSFHYADGDRLVVDHFSHDFKAGSKTAIMGETGIGKTTLFRLLLGFIKPTEGSITLYTNDREHMIGIQTRPNFVFVPQGNTLMSGSIRYNLQLAKPNATDDELLAVLHTACADFINDLPQGLSTELGERGKGLSEGQAQRIAIARGLLCPGNILLLDEISSSLDGPTEQELYKRLFTNCKEKTMLFITHRKTVSELCDEVIRL
ncbi:MAG: ABC transporter ATP-binding protein [Prevotella sp.]|uniref:ABC transporter ATP-binding protein n=1 Tax=Prevotella sp. tf2-5 TaxID=1761889 RepID=UPI0008F2D53E|nr:ABC transporter ATP-binding protein [Prevotella sp. tf2-5]MBR2244551.1 ABC transporter ATP-binding protein [Prevotella sp.]SFO86138.1 ABC-type multidrug transport system, ATPase and permease component [Prevotella sp. tf2-5]